MKVTAYNKSLVKSLTLILEKAAFRCRLSATSHLCTQRKVDFLGVS